MVSTENRTSNPSRNQFRKRQQWPSQTQTLTLIGKSDEIRTNESKERGRKGRGWPTSPSRGTAVTPARGEKKGGPELRSPGSGHRGAAARPLDGGALTRWGARTSARGPATAPGLAARSRRRSLSLGAAVLRREERAVRRRERERESE